MTTFRKKSKTPVAARHWAIRHILLVPFNNSILFYPTMDLAVTE